MSSCFKRWAILLSAALAVWPRDASALGITSVYRTACDRVLGLVLRVDKREIELLDLDGKLEHIPRHQIVSLAYYPISRFPVGDIRIPPEGPRALRIDSLVGDRLETLVEGWPVEFSDQKVAFLQRDGRELVIDRNSIWRLAYVEEPAGAGAPPRPSREIFVHPQAAGFCSEEESAATDTHRVFPQQFLNDEVVIKRELDRLQEGFTQIAQYENDQKFYPVPHLYGNRTSLGVWVAAGSLHGTSNRRTKIAPLVMDELSLGPFRFQHLFLTGVTPNPALLHEEPQAQIYYRFKAAYFHASVMLDPGIILLGEKYLWRASDFSARADARLSEIFAIDLGFDFGPLSIQLFPIVLTDVGLRADGLFRDRVENFWRAGPRLVFRRFEAELIAGREQFDGLQNTYGRLNLSGWPDRHVRLSGSLIYRRHNGRVVCAKGVEPGGSDCEDFPGDFDVATWVAATQAMVPIGHRFAVAASFSIERLRAEWGDPSRLSLTRMSPKGAAFVSFAF